MDSRRPLAGLLTVLWLVACSAGGPPPAATGRTEASASAGAALPTTAPPSRPAFGDIRFVFPVPAMTMLPMQVASALGFDREEGL
jgi:hypothetical protein